MTNSRITDRLQEIFRDAVPDLGALDDEPTLAEQLMSRDPELLRLVQEAREAKAAEEARFREAHEVTAALEEAAEVSGLSYHQLRERLGNPERFAAAEAALAPHTRTRADQRIEFHEAEANRADANDSAETAAQHRWIAESIRREQEWQEQENAAIEASGNARYYPQPADSEAEGNE